MYKDFHTVWCATVAARAGAPPRRRPARRRERGVTTFAKKERSERSYDEAAS